MDKRYNSLNNWLLRRFGERVYKVTLDSGCSCPNRDGTIGRNGCIFCNLSSYNPATAPFGIDPKKTAGEQLRDGISYIRRRHGVAKFISYFQSGSNTHAPAEILAPIFDEAIDHPSVVGLAVSTRPDCIDDEHARLFEKLGRRTLLWIELGLQSARDATLKLINRGHDAARFSSAARALSGAGILTCAHVILGLPGETREMMLDTARFLNAEKVWGVKIHNLHVLRGTKLEELYNAGKIKLPALEEYAGWVADFLEVLNPEIVIHRVNSHSPRSLTVAPEWSINKLAIFNAVEREMENRDVRQGERQTRNSKL